MKNFVLESKLVSSKPNHIENIDQGSSKHQFTLRTRAKHKKQTEGNLSNIILQTSKVLDGGISLDQMILATLGK